MLLAKTILNRRGLNLQTVLLTCTQGRTKTTYSNGLAEAVLSNPIVKLVPNDCDAKRTNVPETPNRNLHMSLKNAWLPQQRDSVWVSTRVRSLRIRPALVSRCSTTFRPSVGTLCSPTVDMACDGKSGSVVACPTAVPLARVVAVALAEVALAEVALAECTFAELTHGVELALAPVSPGAEVALH